MRPTSEQATFPSNMRLIHVSEHGDIERFEPRESVEAAGRRVVWAIDDAHLVNYLVPRECPRVCFRASADTSPADRERLLAPDLDPVVAIEARWFQRASTTPLWLYELPPEGFECVDPNAGYHVTTVAVIPRSRRTVENPLSELVSMGAELRVVPSLGSLAAAVARSTLSFSCIRMRNAGSPDPALGR
jgi:hypothetical protein